VAVAHLPPGRDPLPVLSATAVVSRSAGAPFELEEVEIEAPRAGEVLVDIAAVGVCHTDLTVNGGSFPTPFPVVLGHEGAGVVAAVGPGVTDLAVGDRVALSYDSCGSCRSCLLGQTYHCHAFFEHNFLARRGDGTTGISSPDGPVHSHFFGQSSFATQAIASARSAVVLPPDIPFELAAPLGCGVQTGTGTVLNALAPRAGSSLAVFGVGGVGLSAVMAARVVGASPIIAIDPSQARLELARELGATDAIDANADDPVAAILGLTEVGVDYAVEASGAPAALRQAIDALGPGGVCALVGAPPGGVEVGIDVNTVLARGRTIKAVVEGHSVPRVFIPQLVALWRAGSLPLERLVRTFPLSEINAAAASAERGETVKPVLLPGS
jgi:aryl-alcohol dehydrogenase